MQSPQAASSRIDLPQIFIPDIGPGGTDRTTTSPRDAGVNNGIAQTTDELAETGSLIHSGSIAHRTEDESVTPTAPYGDEASESVSHEGQIDPQSLGLAAAALCFLAKVDSKRGVAAPATSMTDHSLGTTDSLVSGRPSAASRLTTGSIVSGRPSATTRLLTDSTVSGRPSAASRMATSSAISERPSTSSKMPEFFGSTTFRTVLQNPTIAHQLLKFAQWRLCGENLEFLAQVAKYHALLGEVSNTIYEIHRAFISTSAQTQINIPEQILLRTNNEMKKSLGSTLPALDSIFSDAQSDIEQLVYTDIYPRFVRHQISMSAARALGSDRTKYAGLGDCFVLTDPSRADNPIVYASDGFVKVTGYQRSDIIPRNCRFLQSRDTDRSAVRRLKDSIEKRQESVELLLNQKKGGEPFWNLLYTTPLYDAYGKLAFFLGGQINCSTTIHNTSNVLRVLAQPMGGDDETARTLEAASPQPPRSRNIFKDAFRSNMSMRSSIQPRPPGMEHDLLNRIGNKPLKDQMDTFRTAYSNVRSPKICLSTQQTLYVKASAG